MTITPQERLEARILIVDDQQANVELLQDLLHAEGYTQVFSTLDARTVCNWHRKEPFDLILLDLQMPGMDGFQVMDGLRANTPVDDYLPVLVVTAQPGHKLRALRAGARDFVSKPFDLVEVQARIRNLVEVRLQHRKLARHNDYLEQLVQERTAELRESEARYRGLTELATDWYWEQDGEGRFIKVSGPVLEMLGLQVDALSGAPATATDDDWNQDGRREVQTRIAARAPFLDVQLSHTLPDGNVRHYRVSGTPMFDAACQLVGYRGFGVEILPAH